MSRETGTSGTSFIALHYCFSLGDPKVDNVESSLRLEKSADVLLDKDWIVLQSTLPSKVALEK